MAAAYNAIFFEPLLNILIFLYNTIAFEDLGLAIILLTLFVRFVLYPVFHKSVRHQAIMQRLQPQVKKIQDQYPTSKQKQGEAMMALYRENKVNPFSGILLLIVQLPILIALFQIFRNILDPATLDAVYSFVQTPLHINTNFLGSELIPLEERNIVIVALAALTQYFQGRLSLPKIEKSRTLTQAEKVGRQMVYIAPGMTLVILYNLPAAIGLYWLTTALFSIVQQKIVNRKLANDQLGDLRKKADGNQRVQRLGSGDRRGT